MFYAIPLENRPSWRNPPWVTVLLIVLNMAIGALTPPVGGLMFIACAVLNARIVEYFERVLPLLAAEIGVLLLITVFPKLVTFLPDLMMGPGR